MQDDDAARLARHIRLGLAPTRNPFIGRVTVYSEQQHELLKLQNTNRPNILRSQKNRSELGRAQDLKLRPIDANLAKMKQQRTEQIKQLFEHQKASRAEAARRSKEIVLQKIHKKENTLLQMLSTIIGSSRSIDSIERYLDRRDAAQKEKTRNLCEVWNDRVFQVIQKQINDNVNDAKTLQRIRMRNKLYSQYLRASSQGRAVFLDLISTDVYDPFKWTRLDSKYSVKSIRDPIKRDLRKYAMERKDRFKSSSS